MSDSGLPVDMWSARVRAGFSFPSITPNLWIGLTRSRFIRWLSVRLLFLLGLQATKLFSLFDQFCTAYAPSVPGFLRLGVGKAPRPLAFPPEWLGFP